MVSLEFIEREIVSVLYGFFIEHIMNWAFIAVVIVSAMLAIRFLDVIYISVKKRLGEKWGIPVNQSAVKLGVYAVATVMVLMAIPGLSTNFLQLIGLAGGAVIAFSSSTLIANGMAGVMIKLTKPYDVGDVMSFKEHFGKVYHIGLLHTEVQTLHREIVNVPNLLAISDVIVNYTEGNYLVNVTINLGYDVSHTLAEKLLLEAVSRTSRLKQGFVLMTEMSAFGVDYEVNALLDNVEKKIRKESELRKNIFDVFFENNVQIMTPTYMMTKQLYHDETVLPDGHQKGPKRGVRKPERVMFEKAEEIIEHKSKGGKDSLLAPPEPEKNNKKKR